MGITKEEVFQAAEALAARGASVTNQAVREHLGGRGSFSTLAPHLRAWHDGRTAARKEAHTPAPSEVGAGWTRTLDSLWSAALAEARRLAHAEHEGQVAATHAALEEAHAEIARLEAEGQRREEERTAAVMRADAEHAAALDLRMELGAARERAAAIEVRIAEEAQRREVAEAAHGAAREKVAEIRGALTEAHAEIARLEANEQQRAQENMTLLTQAAAERTAALELQSELGAERERAAASEALVEAERAAALNMRAEMSKAREHLIAIEARMAEETRRREDAEKERAAAREETAQMRGALGVLEQQRQTR